MPVNADPVGNGRRLAAFFQAAEPRLWRDLSDAVAGPDPDPAAVRSEWECLALDACLRGLVAAGGFGEHTVRAIDAFHETVLAGWAAEADEPELAPRRERLTTRYEEYGRLARELEARGAALVSARLGERAAAYACAPAPADAKLAALFAALHESLVEGALAALDTPASAS